jgi:hypothetical protein
VTIASVAYRTQASRRGRVAQARGQRERAVEARSSSPRTLGQR